MCTSILLVALTGFAPAQVAEAPSWLMDYTEGRAQGRTAHKPLAVFVASGKEGWDKLARDGSLGKEVNSLLAGQYVCVYLDSTTLEGKSWAKALDLENGLGLVISDQSGRLMAFHHQGDLGRQALVEYLRRYADPERQVRTTETNPTTYTRSYPAPQPAPAAPAFWPSGGFSGGRSC